MSRWTHACCETCWEKQNPSRYPVRFKEPDLEDCCFCEAATRSGIYVRRDPDELRCKGEHP